MSETHKAASSDKPYQGAGASYKEKPDHYFAGCRTDIVSALKTSAGAAILEIGCGAGATGAAALAAGKAKEYVGIEISDAAAEVARGRLTRVIVGDVENLDLSSLQARFDAIIISEVLEHLTQPWETVRRLALCMRPGGRIYASSPNVAHWQVIRSLLAGRFEYEDAGVMDRTHIRWFTPRSYSAMFTAAGFLVESVEELEFAGWKARLVNWVTRGRFSHLFTPRIMLVAVRP